MSTRTSEELIKEIELASDRNDVGALERCAAELGMIGTTNAQAEAANTLGWAAFNTSRYDDALGHYHRAIELFREVDDQRGIANVAIRAGMVYTITGVSSKALEYYYTALAIWEDLGDGHSIAATNANIGIVLKNTGDLSGALDRYRTSLAVYQEHRDHGGIASVLCSIGNVHLITGSFPNALANYNRALDIYQELGNKRYVAANCSNIGHIYDGTGDYPTALEHYHRALAIYEEIEYRNGIANVNTDIGNLYVNIGQSALGLEHLQRALEIYNAIGNRFGIAIATGAIGGASFDLGDHQKALEHLYRSLELNREMNAAEGLVVNSNAILSVLIANRSYAEAKELLSTIDAMDVTDPRAHIQRERSRASILTEDEELDAAMSTLRDALDLAVTQSLAPEQAAIHKHLRDLCQKRMDFAGYIEHNNAFTRITEEINGKDTATKVALQDAERKMAKERAEHERHLAILHSALPKHIADRVARGEVVNDQFDNAAVIFLDVVGFTTLSNQLTSDQVVSFLDTMFTTLDAVCKQHDVVKIKTIGDSYMAVAFPLESSSSEQRVASPQERAANAALKMLHVVSHIVSPASSPLSSPESSPVRVRIGIHSGTLTAGVIGTDRLQYDVWGDTVNVASRMESTGVPGRIHVSEAFAYALTSPPSPLFDNSTSPPSPLSSLRGGTVATPRVIPSDSDEHGTWHLAPRGEIEIKGKGTMRTYWLSEIQHHS